MKRLHLILKLLSSSQYLLITKHEDITHPYHFDFHMTDTNMIRLCKGFANEREAQRDILNQVNNLLNN